VLRLEIAHELVVGDLDAEMAQELTHEPGILDLLDRAGRPEEGFVVLAKMLGDHLCLGQFVPAERRQACAVPRFDQIRVVTEVHEGVAPVEEDRLEHGCLG
jgi:hypothetical protein